jgi:DNA-binding CsgD family transcriptional regulator
MLVLSLGPIVSNAQGRFFESGVRLFGLDGPTLAGLVYFLGAALLFLFLSLPLLRLYARSLSILAACSFLVWLLLPPGLPALLISLLFCFLLGGCASLSAFSYVHALNPPERFLGAVMSSVFYMASQAGFALGLVFPGFHKGELALAVLLTLVCLNLYRDGDLSEPESRSKEGSSAAMPLMLFFFFAHRTIESFYVLLPQPPGSQALLWGGLAGIFGAFLCLAAYFWMKLGVWNLCSLYFIAMIASFAAYTLREIPGSLALSQALHGFEGVGFILSLYLFGRVMAARKDIRDFSRVWLMMLFFLFIAHLAPRGFFTRASGIYLMVTGLLSFVLFAAYLLLLPAYAHHLFEPHLAGEWENGLKAGERASQRLEFLRSKGLTPRELEVAQLLLKGRTARQCAAEIGISEDTVKYHMKHLYRKLGISGRSELFMLLDGLPGNLPAALY